jgi:hypothetical protein
MGLKVGIHTLRGSVSAAAVAAKSPVLGGGGATVDQIVNASAGTCSWNKGWFAVNMSHPAATAWFDSVYGQYADWGVDLIKVRDTRATHCLRALECLTRSGQQHDCIFAQNDCIFAQNMAANNIKAVSAAIKKTGRQMTYSLSPGGQVRVTQSMHSRARPGASHSVSSCAAAAPASPDAA